MQVQFTTLAVTTIALIAGVSCSTKKVEHDASGVFEARETVIAAETSGQILSMPIEVGQTVGSNALAAEIDCQQLLLQREQVLASKLAIGERTTEAKPQLQIYREEQRAAEAQLAVQAKQHEVLEKERVRFASLVQKQAATPKELSDIEGQVAVLERQMESTKVQIAIMRQRAASYRDQVALQNRAVESELLPTEARVASIDDQIKKCKVLNPVAGTVLAKYAEQYEFATPGKPLYRVADLSTVDLRAYITGDQLSQVKLNQPVKVFVDAGPQAFRTLMGTVVWVAEKAEFTPKTVQTKSERSNLVYAIKVRVKNDGSLKIGMYAEVAFR